MQTGEAENSSGVDSNAAADSVDQILRRAREERDLGVDEVAIELRLDQSVILALESGDFASLSATDGYLELPLEETSFPAGTAAQLHRW